MSAEEERLNFYKCDEGLQRLKKFLLEIGANKPLCLNAFCRKTHGRLWIYCIDDAVAGLTIQLSSSGVSIYHAGFSVGYLDENKRFFPSLELGWELALSKTVPDRMMITLSESQEREFIFGRVIRLGDRAPSLGEYLLVLNKKGEFLGWGKIIKGTLHPVSDVGAYIRFKE